VLPADARDAARADDSRSGTSAAALAAPQGSRTGDGPLAISSYGGAGDSSQAPQSPDTASVAALKQVIEERRPDTIEILRNWLEDDTVKETA